MAKYALVKGSIMSFDGGKIRLEVRYYNTNSSITFIPYVKITDEFKSKHKVKVDWQGTSEKFGKDHAVTVKGKDTKRIGKNPYNNGDYQVKIRLMANGKKTQITLTNSKMVPAKPDMKVERTNDYRFSIKVSQTENKKDIPTRKVTLERLDDATSASWTEVKVWNRNSDGKWSESFTDQGVERGHRYQYRVKAENANGSSGYNFNDEGWIYTLPPDISDVTHVRNSNTQNTVTWSKSGQELDRGLIKSYEVWRSASGGAFVKIADVLPGAIQDGTVSYEDKTCSVDNYYSYIVKPVNKTGVSAISYPSDQGTDPTYNSPSAPLKVTAVMQSNNTIKVLLDNRTKTADVLQIAKYQDGTWTQFEDIDESEGPVTEYIDESSTTGTVVKFRARNGREDLEGSERYSQWTVSDELEVLSKPNPPTLVRPVDGTAVTLDHDTLRFEWIHNPTDGTAQTQAQITIVRNGQSVASYTTTTEQYKDINIANYSPLDVITWKVKTKGQHSDWSEFSEIRTFTCYALPELHITSPQNGSVIQNLPLDITYTYSNLSGSLSKLTLDILKDNEIVFTKDITPETGSSPYTYTLDDYLFDNETSYTLKLTSLSDIGLQAVDEIGLYVDYVSVLLSNQYLIDTDPDPETGYVSLMISEAENVSAEDDPDPDIPQPTVVNSPVAHAYLYRVYDGKKTLLGEVHDGSQIVDKYAPINAEYSYEMLEIATTGEIAIVSLTNEIDSEYWYVYYGQDLSKIARALWNPNGDVSLSRPEKQQIIYSGREYPVTYDSGANEEKYSFSSVITDRDELNAFREMMKSGGQGVWKSADGFVYKADFEFSFSADYTAHEQAWDAKLEVTRIEGDL